MNEHIVKTYFFVVHQLSDDKNLCADVYCGTLQLFIKETTYTFDYLE